MQKWLISLSLVVGSPLWSGGICLYEIGTADMRLASAGWSARAEDPSTAFTNPAGMTRLCETQAEFGLQPIFEHIDFDKDEGTTVCGKDGHANKWLPAGSFFFVKPLNDSLTIGGGSLGYFGADLDYQHDWAGRYYVQKVLLQGISFIGSAAYKLNCQWSVGAGLNVMYGFFKQRAAIRNLLDVERDGYLRVKDYHYGFGGVFGILYEHDSCTRFGVQYLTPVQLKFRSKPVFRGLGPVLNELLNLAGLIGSTIDLTVKVPQSVIFSAYHAASPSWNLMCNLGWQQWSKFEEITVTLAAIDRNSITFTPKFKDTWHAAIGAEAYWSEQILLSAGLAYDSSAVSKTERTPNFPIGSQWRIGTGARWYYSERLTLDLSTELQWQGDLKMKVDRGRFAGAVEGTYKNTYGFFTSANVIYHF
ncbi:MAG: outer membrane protein transport protein [Parachlamydia sp.]|jgi:long-chain fatty acid transport protein|nr:outer membrane protein transport protein [Parachlamydia sp.]